MGARYWTVAIFILDSAYQKPIKKKTYQKPMLVPIRNQIRKKAMGSTFLKTKKMLVHKRK
jgi:hypothetical protein